MKQLIVFLLLPFAFAQCKKDICASRQERLDKAPVIDLSASDLSRVPYYDSSTVTFIRNNSWEETFDFSSGSTSYIPVEDKGTSSACPDYKGKYQQTNLIFKSQFGSTLTLYHTTKSFEATPSRHVMITVVMGNQPREVSPGNFQDQGVMGIIDTRKFDSAPDIQLMQVNGRIYTDIYTSVYSHTLLNLGTVTDYMYYTASDGVIRAERQFGDVYELVK